MEKESRFDILDSYRFIAILSVMLYHYYSRWTPPQNNVSYYPYGSGYDHFSFGWLGVQFFFIISGFVIAFTLTRTGSLTEFWKKRLIRLLPSMFICSLVTLSLFRILDTHMLFPASHSIKNFLYSLTLLSPELLNKLFLMKVHGTYLNGSYWSIWTELQFYFLASIVYFINRKNFVRNITVFIIILCVVDFLITLVLTNVHPTNAMNLTINENIIRRYYKLRTMFDFVYYSLYFAIGVLFFQLYSKEKIIMTMTLLITSVMLMLFLGSGLTLKEFLPVHSIFIMILLFVVFIYYSNRLSISFLKPFSKIGVASYSLYLIHEVIGVLLINKYASSFGRYDFIFPVLVILLMISFALFSFRYIEKPIGSYLKKKLI